MKGPTARVGGFRRALAWGGVAAFSIGAALAAGAPSEASVKPATIGECSSCNCKHQQQENTEGWLTAKATMRSGPAESCGFVSSESQSTYFFYYCYVVNENTGNTWTYGRSKATGATGWIYDGRLHNDGSHKPCEE